jgi:hypothetical protein
MKPYPGYYFTGDGCRRDEDGYIWITGRVDDVLNVSGHRIGTAEVESALVAHQSSITFSLLLLCTTAPAFASAQDEGQAPAPASAEEAAAEPLAELPSEPAAVASTALNYEVTFRASSLVQGYNNLDLRPFDGSSDATVRDTDDKSMFGYSDAGAHIVARPSDRLSLTLDGEVETQWPAFVLNSSPTAIVSLYGLSLGVSLFEQDGVSADLSMGRQPFSIGGVPKDYMMSGSVDGLVATIRREGESDERHVTLDRFEKEGYFGLTTKAIMKRMTALVKS